MTIRNQPGKGVMVWAGLLHDSAAGKPQHEIGVSDYVQRETVSFARWTDVWEYFETDPHFAPLLAVLRVTVEERIASGANLSAQTD
ncbi:MAG: hypothetical protein ABIR16_06150 [Dokdonella sp.]